MLEALRRILYVEDDQDIAELVQLTLTEIGHFEVQYCDSGEHALGTLDSFQPQLILMDVMMPAMDGPTTLENIRKLTAFKHTPVFFMTAKVQSHEKDKFYQMGVKHVIEKPFDPISLPDEIKLMWEKAHES